MEVKEFPNQSTLKKNTIDFLINIPLFDELNGEELSIVADYIAFIEVASGEYLFKEGDKGDYMCFVVNGTLDVIKQCTPTKNVILSTIYKGHSIGEMAVIDHTPRSASIKAREVSNLLVLSEKNFDIIINSYPRIGVKLLKRILRLLSLNMRRTSSKLADNMLMMSQILKKDKSSK
ncbi:MAG: cyclic nucleotide-binding domain-containing protein [Desulfobacterales bacterium]|nr:cyclic nucleotide-binding domain-containing protein [Desulfobacterales bacterium]